MGESSFNKTHFLTICILVFLIFDVAFLNYKLFIANNAQQLPKEDVVYNQVHVATDSVEETVAPKVVDSCYPLTCPELIRQATASSNKKTTTQVIQAKSSSADKEFYIPLGAGQTTNDQWEDVAGLTAYIDSTKYSKIKTVTFEASMRIPTANGIVYARLYNATDNHPVWFSEVSAFSNTSSLFVSPPITLDTGNKLYKVQMKTSLKYESILDQARVHILTQ